MAEQVEQLRLAGNECFKAGDYAGAVAKYDEAVALAPGNHLLHRGPRGNNAEASRWRRGGAPSAAAVVGSATPRTIHGIRSGCDSPLEPAPAPRTIHVASAAGPRLAPADDRRRGPTGKVSARSSRGRVDEDLVVLDARRDGRAARGVEVAAQQAVRGERLPSENRVRVQDQHLVHAEALERRVDRDGLDPVVRCAA